MSPRAPAAWRPPLGLALLGLALGAACSSGAGPTTVNFVLPAHAEATTDYFDLPFPNELRRQADGSIDLAGVPAPTTLVSQYLDAVSHGSEGFGTQSAVFFRLSGPINEATLPDPAGSTQHGAAIQLVDVDPTSPGRGTRTPLRIGFTAAAGKFIGANALALRPYPGFPLRPGTLHAAIVTTAIADVHGRPLAAAPAFAQLVAGRGDATARAAYQPLLDFIAPGDAGVTAKELAGAAVFRTGTPTALMARLRSIVTSLPAPTPAGVTHTGTLPYSEVFEGTYDGPNFQQGDPPYKLSGGALNLDATGTPVVVRTENLRFAISVPQGPMPADGWPIVLYAHGTGGDYRSFIGEGVATNVSRVLDASGAEVARLAMISIDQVLHGPRDPTGSDPDLTFFNFQNLPAARDNVRQGGLDDFQLLRLVRTLTLTMPDGSTAFFDPARIGFMGHSQGGLTGPLFLAYAPEVRAAVLSGAGGNLILSLLHKTQPVDIPGLIAVLLQETPDEFHPLLNLLQMYLEPADPGNYGPLFFQAPPADVPAKDIFQSLGVVDHYTPVPAIMALAVAMGVQPVAPLLLPVDGMDLAGVASATPPITGNVAGGATGVLCEYPAASGSDGHFVVYDIAEARAQYGQFLASGLAVGAGRAQLVP